MSRVETLHASRRLTNGVVPESMTVCVPSLKVELVEVGADTAVLAAA